jgi:hypothetical protein
MKNNKGFAPILIALIIVAVLAVGGVAYYVGKKSNTLPKVEENNFPEVNQNNVVNNSVPPTLETKESTIIADSNDPNIKIYTSFKLGVKFKYASIDPMFNSAVPMVTELNNKINGSGGYLIIFDKNSNESLEDAVRRIIFKGRTDFKNCSIKVGKSWNTNLDSTVRLAYADGSFPGDEDESDCPQNYFGSGRTFAASSKYSDRFVFIQISTQSPDDIIYKTGDKLTNWESTIELINK